MAGLKVSAKTDENYFNIDMGYIRALDMIRFFHPLSLDAISKTLGFEKCFTITKHGLERRNGVFPIEWLDSLDKLDKTQLPPKEAFYSKLNIKILQIRSMSKQRSNWKRRVVKKKKDCLLLNFK